MADQSNRPSQANQLARKILTFSRDTLLVNLRFLDAAIHQFKLEQVDELGTITIDGQRLLDLH